MNTHYFNFSYVAAEDRGEIGSFLARWRRIFATDPRWVPPYYPALRQALDPGVNPHLDRMAPIYLYTQAMARSAESDPLAASFQFRNGVSQGIPFERTVAAGVLLRDPRRRDGRAYFALFHCINDLESMERFLATAAERLAEEGYRELLGPLHLSPYLGGGLLLSHWHQLPPLHTAYNPPYLPDLAAEALEPVEYSQLYKLDIPEEAPPPSGKAQIEPLDPGRLAGDLLPLMASACPAWTGFPPPDREEAQFILKWTGEWPLQGWAARVGEQIVGFVLLQPDLAPHLLRAGGGRSPFWRLWLRQASQRPVRQGRLLFFGVLPHYRGQGTGSQLLHQALVAGREAGWQRLTLGPVPEGSQAASFFERHGAQPGARYGLYQWGFREGAWAFAD